MTDGMERALGVYASGDFAAALEELDAAIAALRPDDATEELALGLWHSATCLDRLGREEEAECRYIVAEALSTRPLLAPLRLERAEFQELVVAGLETLPAHLRAYIDQVAIVIEDWPGPECDDPFALGFYVGVPRTERDESTRDHLDRVYVYQRSHELQFPTEEELREEARKTILHEIGHHFGLGEEDMGEYA